MPDTTIILTATAAPVSAGEASTHVRRHTAYDALERILDVWGTGSQKISQREARRAILDAYRELSTAHQWTYLWTHGRINLNAAYDTGTVTYDHTGGTYERQLTLASGTWPTWATLGMVRISGITYKVDRRISSTVLTLDSVQNPGEDVAAGTSYTLAQDTYEMPSDFIAGDSPIIENNWSGMRYMRPVEWLNALRLQAETYSETRWYTFMGERGRIVMKIWPPSDTAQTLDFNYLRGPRPISIFEQTTGTATVDINTFPKRVTLSGGTFTESMVGSIIRLSSDATNLPDGPEGDFPAAEERTIQVYVSSTVVEVDADFEASYAAVKYRVSDPIDFEEYAMNAYWRCVEKQGSIQRVAENQLMAEEAYHRALRLACAADSRVLARRTASLGKSGGPDWADLPRGDDAE